MAYFFFSNCVSFSRYRLGLIAQSTGLCPNRPSIVFMHGVCIAFLPPPCGIERITVLSSLLVISVVLFESLTAAVLVPCCSAAVQIESIATVLLFVQYTAVVTLCSCWTCASRKRTGHAGDRKLRKCGQGVQTLLGRCALLHRLREMAACEAGCPRVKPIQVLHHVVPRLCLSPAPVHGPRPAPFTSISQHIHDTLYSPTRLSPLSIPLSQGLVHAKHHGNPTD